jgi:tetratricopeptide (TPR) repeat protein
MDAIRELLDRRVLEATDAAAMLRFAHDKLRDAAHDSMDAERRGALHAAAARAIEQNCGGEAELQLHYDELASHWEEAHQIDKAVDYYEKAALLALRTGASRRAAELLQHVIDVHGSSDRVRVSYWHRLLSAAQFGLGDLHASSKFAAEAMHLLGVRLPSTRAGWIRAFSANLLEQMAHLVLPWRLFRASRSQWPRLTEAAHSAQRLAESGFYAVDALSMMTCGLIAVNLAERCGAMPNVARVYAMLGLISGACGTPRIARRYFAQAVKSASAADDVAGEAFGRYCSATYYVSTAEWELAEHAVEESIRLSDMTGDPQDMEIALTLRGHIQFYTGAIAEAKATYTRIRETARARSNFQHMGWGHIGVARSLILEGHLDDAIAESESARRVAGNDHMIEVISTSHEAMAQLYKGDLDRARELADKACGLVSESMPTIFEMARAYSVSCEVFLALWNRDAAEQVPTAHRLEERVFRLCGSLRTLARRFPIIAPAHARLRGVAWLQRGKESRARRWLSRALISAKRLQLPIETALAHIELSRLPSLDHGIRRSHEKRARAILESKGSPVYIERIDFRRVTQPKLHVVV